VPTARVLAMQTLIYISLAVNILVLIPIVVLMSIRARLVDKAWGPFTEARGILLSIYFAILVASVVLLFMPAPAFVAALLAVQVIYKVTTPITVGRISNPVVISNLFIAALHVVTLASIFMVFGDQLLTVR
jgi:hypothetical protein